MILMSMWLIDSVSPLSQSEASALWVLLPLVTKRLMILHYPCASVALPVEQYISCLSRQAGLENFQMTHQVLAGPLRILNSSAASPAHETRSAAVFDTPKPQTGSKASIHGSCLIASLFSRLCSCLWHTIMHTWFQMPALRC